MMLLDARDTLAAASDLHLDRTAASNLLLAHTSAFWDTRGAIRTQVLNHVVPHLEDLFSLLNSRPGVPEGGALEEIAIPRLQRMNELCEAHGAQLILMVPPTLSSESAVSQMASAARRAGVEVSVPIDPAALSAGFYQPDGMHLNRQGAVLFTSALAKDLSRADCDSRHANLPVHPMNSCDSKLSLSQMPTVSTEVPSRIALQQIKSPSLYADFSWMFVGNAIYAGGQFATLMLLAKLVRPELVGQYAFGSRSGISRDDAYEPSTPSGHDFAGSPADSFRLLPRPAPVDDFAGTADYFRHHPSPELFPGTYGGISDGGRGIRHRNHKRCVLRETATARQNG